ncbi:MAG: hypothetical protein V4671_09350, partial [Armatimonadota bacterium]
YCRVPISWRYFGVELLTACLWVALFFQVADRSILSWVDFLAQALFVSVLIAVIFIDLDHFIIPDELNWFGIAFGVLRDIVCLALGWYAVGGAILRDAVERYGFAGLAWLPRSFVGALVYGGAIYLVSFLGWIYYARAEGESMASVSRRFLTMEDYEEPERGAVVTPAADTPVQTETEEEEPEGEAIRLGFSPAFLALLSALVLLPVIKAWALLFFVVPLAAFTLMSRREGETLNAAAGRFFRSNDQGAPEPSISVPSEPEAVSVSDSLPLLPGDERLSMGDAPLATPSAHREMTASEMTAQLRVEADEFALEAEKGTVGGMGLGDAKLALAIGAILGPGPALLSLFMATFAGAATGITLARVHGRTLRLALPFGPFMAFGAIVVMLYGPQILDWYFGTFMPPPAPLPSALPR